MQQSNTLRAWRRKAISLLLALTILLGLVPGFPGASETASAHWADSYLSQLVEWGFIREDQAGYPDRALTRAEFMAIVNRAYGYHEMGETPFEDVAVEDWYYDDVGIAYTARYINGTSPTTASPNHALTRETAATILGRNMMLEESNGELLDFTDARQISSWAKGTIKSSLEHYLVSGYDDGTFRPQRNVSWGEMASMVTALVGTPLQEAGDYALGGVYGNVTITSPGVKLRDTVVSGDLYITGGVGLGGVELENVTVLGRIIASGAGQAEGGADSILLRNVTADELLVDNLQDNYVSVRADGVTEIGKTTVRTSAYIEDNTPEGLGLQYISLEAESYPEGEEPEGWVPPQLDLAGRIGEVVNRTPGSQVRAASGTVAKLTVDEAAVGSTVIIDRGTVVKELNLDTGVEVTGQGDVGKLTVNAPGCTVEMLPDEIEIRPGITATINGEEMDSVAAKESSEQPMILAGYPEAQDVVPTGLDAAFMTNKAGTIYWAVSALTDGSVGEEDLIKPPSYGNIAVKNGSVKVAKGNEETISKVAGLTPGGSYYLSAILVDGRGQRSAVKVISFTTPDNTVPAFNTGYPRMSKVSRTDSVVVVMPNKDCKLYYALLPESAAAPTENELKSSAVAGALGYGVRDVKKNVEDAFRVNDVILDETTNYVLYLWLVDADGVNKGKITPLKFTTDDETPPEFIVKPYAERTTANSANMKFQLSEAGTVYWVAFPSGSVKNFPLGEPGTGEDTAPWTSMYAIQQVVNGMNIGADGKSGQVSVKNNKDGNFIGTFNITGMKPETSYDVYFVAKDNAGPDRNYSISIDKVTVTPQDANPPVITQLFTNTVDPKDKTQNPRSNTGILLEISENVRHKDSNRSYVELGEDADKERNGGSTDHRAVNLLASTLYESIKLFRVDPELGPVEVNSVYNTGKLPFADDMTLDYTQATVGYISGSSRIRVTFPPSALHLENGAQYFFTIKDLVDLSGNPLQPDDEFCVDFWNNKENSVAAGHSVNPFVVEFARVVFSEPIMTTSPKDINNPDNNVLMSRSVNFRMTPTSTSSVDDIYSYDIVIWNDKSIAYDLYYRVVDKKGSSLYDKAEGKYPDNVGTAEEPITDYLLHKPNANVGSGGNLGKIDENGWIYLGNSDKVQPNPDDWRGRSVSQFFNGCNTVESFSKLNSLNENLCYDFVMTVTYFDNKSDPSGWDGDAYFYVNVAAGQPTNLINLPERPDTDDWDELESRRLLGGLQSIGFWGDADKDPDTLVKWRKLSPSGLPAFISPTPTLIPAATSLSVKLGLTSDGLVHYAISEVGEDGSPEITTVRAVMNGTGGTTKDLKDDGSLKDTVKLYDNERYTGPFVDHAAVDEDKRLMYVTMDSPDAPWDGGTNAQRPIRSWMKGGGPTDSSQRDEPMGKNLIVYPENTTVVNKAWEGSEAVSAGEFRPKKDIIDTLEVAEELKPETDYFIYFVITLPDDRETASHVYIYHFKTLEASKPKTDIKLPGRGSSGDVDMGVDEKNAMANWRVYSLSDSTNGNISILSKPFSLFTAHPGVKNDNGAYIDSTTGEFDLEEYRKAEGSDKTPDIYLKNKDGSLFTVLDALTTPYRYTLAKSGYSEDQLKTFYFPIKGTSYTAYDRGYTVFDMYANADAREYLYTLVQDGALGNPESVSPSVIAGPAGSNDMKKAALQDSYYYNLQEISKLPIMSGSSSSSRFLFLMTAENPAMITDVDQSHATIASFRASPFQKDSLVPPKVIGGSGGITKDQYGNTYSGRVTVDFELDTFLAQNGGNSLDLTKDNLFKGIYPLTYPVPSDAMKTTEAVSPRSFTLEINSIQAGPNGVLSFPANYFANLSNIAAEQKLEISVGAHPEKSDGKVYLVITWGGKVVYASEAQAYIPPYNLEFGGGIQGGSNDPKLTLDLTDNNKKSANITADIRPSNLTGVQYRWGPANSDVMSLTPGTTEWNTINDTTVTAARPGKATVTASGTGTDSEGNSQEATNSFPVTVLGSVDDFVMTSVTTATATASLTATNACAMTIGGTVSPSITLQVKANSQDLSSSATVSYKIMGNVLCTVVGDKITITPGKNPAEGEAKVEIGLLADNTDLTPNGKKTITITLTKATTYGGRPSADNNNQVKPTSLTLSNDHLNGSTLTLRSDDKGTAVQATINPSGATGTVTWDTTYTDTNVATVTQNGTVTPKGIGSTTVTAKVTGTSISKTITINVRGAISGLTMTSPTKSTSNVTWNSGSNSLTLARGGGVTPTATFTVKAAGDAAVSNKTALVTCSVPKDQKDYVKCTIDPSNNKITIAPGSASPAKDTTVKVTIGIVTRSGSISLTPGISDKLVLNVQIKGNDASLNVAGKLNR